MGEGGLILPLKTQAVRARHYCYVFIYNFMTPDSRVFVIYFLFFKNYILIKKSNFLKINILQEGITEKIAILKNTDQPRAN